MRGKTVTVISVLSASQPSPAVDQSTTVPQYWTNCDCSPDQLGPGQSHHQGQSQADNKIWIIENGKT